ncbi:MAG: hypothetical protein CMI96_03320 [Pelagibacteraceae bacterium]|nr:hypothetical protein [Pelagibacteraceae bacterium]
MNVLNRLHKKQMFKFYKISSVILIPFIILNVHWRILKNKEDKVRYKERYGLPSKKNDFKKKVIWIHAASIGEFKSADFIIKNYFKNNFILITTTTKSAAKYVEDNYSNMVIHQYAPFDISKWVLRFVNYWKPNLVLWIESDIWPNTMNILEHKKIKTIYLNARISPNSFSRWKLIRTFYESILRNFTYIFAQSLDDKKRLELLTNLKIDYIGNLKLTKNKTKSFNKKSDIFTILCASTHKKEESLILKEFKKIYNHKNKIKYYFAPRHPERFNAVLNLLKKNNYQASMASQMSTKESNVTIIDNFGNMDEYFYLSDIVILGGSFVKKGGHNPLEPAKYNCAIISGKYNYNWKNIYQEMKQNNACIILKETNEIFAIINKLINSKEILDKLKLNAYNFSKKIFFEEEKLKKIINESLY